MAEQERRHITLFTHAVVDSSVFGNIFWDFLTIFFFTKPRAAGLAPQAKFLGDVT